MSEGNVFSGSAAGELDASVTTNLGGLPDDWRFLLFLKKLGRHIFFFLFFEWSDFQVQINFEPLLRVLEEKDQFRNYVIGMGVGSEVSAGQEKWPSSSQTVLGELALNNVESVPRL